MILDDPYNQKGCSELRRAIFLQKEKPKSDVTGQATTRKQLMLFAFDKQEKQTAVTAYFTSTQLPLLVFELQDSLLPSSAGILTAVQRQTAVTAYFTSNQLLVFELQDSLLPSSTGILTAVQRQTAVTANFTSKQYLPYK